MWINLSSATEPAVADNTHLAFIRRPGRDYRKYSFEQEVWNVIKKTATRRPPPEILTYMEKNKKTHKQDLNTTYIY